MQISGHTWWGGAPRWGGAAPGSALVGRAPPCPTGSYAYASYGRYRNSKVHVVGTGHISKGIFKIQNGKNCLEASERRNIFYLYWPFFFQPDLTPPVVTGCPGSITETIADGTQLGGVVDYTPPQAEDNSGIVTLISSPPSPGFFDLGTTLVSYIYRDGALNGAECLFTVTVTTGD